jgi:hypothetical protein
VLLLLLLLLLLLRSLQEAHPGLTPSLQLLLELLHTLLRRLPLVTGAPPAGGHGGHFQFL